MINNSYKTINSDYIQRKIIPGYTKIKYNRNSSHSSISSSKVNNNKGIHRIKI